MEGKFKPDPEKYKHLAQPRAEEEAERDARNFIKAVGVLREKFRIPEVVIHFEVNVQRGEEVEKLTGGCGWGNQLKQARLARRAADRELEHLGKLIETAAVVLPELWRTLITDPVAQVGWDEDK